MSIAQFCATRTSETPGLTWKSYAGDELIPLNTTFEGQLYEGRLKTQESRNAIPIPEDVIPIIEAWRSVSKNTSPMRSCSRHSAVAYGKEKWCRLRDRTADLTAPQRHSRDLHDERAAGFSRAVSHDDTAYFDALVRMFEQALETTNILAGNIRSGLLLRLDRVRNICHGFGYGVSDDMDVLLSEFFPSFSTGVLHGNRRRKD